MAQNREVVGGGPEDLINSGLGEGSQLPEGNGGVGGLPPPSPTPHPFHSPSFSDTGGSAVLRFCWPACCLVLMWQ